MKTVTELCKEIEVRLEQCNDKEPEKWDPETRSYSYPKWDEFTNHAPIDITRLLAIVRVQQEALKSISINQSILTVNESGTIDLKAPIYPSLETIAREALRKADELAGGGE